MRAIWKGAVSFGLVNVPIRLYSATENHDVQFRQVHREDGGRIKYQRVCSIDGEPVSYDDIAKGYETEDGDMVVLTDEDLKDLPLASSKEIAVQKFVPAEQIDPMLLDKSYYLEPDKAAAKPYILLRDALEQADRMAVVTVAIRTRTTMAVLRVKDGVIVMQTMLWPDEIRAADFATLDEDAHATGKELEMANMLIESLAGDYDPAEYEDDYAQAVEALVTAKLEGGEVRQAPSPRTRRERSWTSSPRWRSRSRRPRHPGRDNCTGRGEAGEEGRGQDRCQEDRGQDDRPRQEDGGQEDGGEADRQEGEQRPTRGMPRGRAAPAYPCCACEAQAFSRRKVAVPHQIARANSAVAHSEPHTIGEVAKSPANEVRTASTTQRKGIQSLAASSQSGPIVMGSRIPESSSTGIITMLMTGAMTSSLGGQGQGVRGRGAGAADEQREEYAEGDPAADASMPMAKPRPTRMKPGRLAAGCRG